MHRRDVPDMPSLAARGLVKRYGSTLALNDVDFDVQPGRVVALLGENGAGKSTLVKVLAGATTPTRGTISLGGSPLTLREPRDAISAGIVHIPQELAYAPDLTVAENIALGSWPRSGPFISRKRMREQAEREFERLHVSLSPSRRMNELKLAERQLVEIAKALARRARVLLLDEPTAALNAMESAQLFNVVSHLADQQVAVAFISHRMDEVLAHSDHLVVLRNGVKTLDTPTAGAREAEIVDAMIGDVPVRTHTALGVRSSGRGLRALVRVPELSDEEVELQVSPGHVLGLFGVRGSGCEAIVEGLAGASQRITGQLELDGRFRRLFHSPREALAAGVLFVPAERKIGGLVMTQSIKFNIEMLAFGRVSRFGVMRTSAARNLAEHMTQRLNIRCRSVSQKVSELSGGNQQKVLLAGRLAAQRDIYLLHEPTRGIDVGARAEVHELIRELADAGLAVLLVSSDVEECVEASDRVLAIKDGRVAADLAGSEKTQAAAIAFATGKAA